MTLALPRLREFPASADPWIAEPVPAPGAEAAESLPQVPPFVAMPAMRPLALATPPIRSHEPELGAAEFNTVRPAAVITGEPTIRRVRAGTAPISTMAARLSGQPERPRPAIPAPGLIQLEFYCQRISARPMARVTWKIPGLASAHPLPFALALATERAEEVQALKPETRQKGQIADILSHPEAIALRARSRKLGRYGKIAACLMVAGSLWLGARVVNFGRRSIEAPPVAAIVRAVPTGPSATAPARSEGGAIATVKRVIASRAAIEAADNFRGGMEAWGATPKSWVKGWSRHPDGYVHPGDLALFHPSLTYKDYRMEFYGQIEQTSMDWVVRASDKENYYAMKFKVVAPGIRPVIAMVHYPVVGGKAGHRVETPLNVMVHNNRPYHVTVDVKGSRYTASIEGEAVESWTDNTLLAGGVGFFSEAGERARVYWMRVSKNQDWIGRVCAFIAGTPDDGPKTIAEFWPPEFPAGVPVPARPRQRDPETLFGAVVLGGLPGRFRQVSSNLRRVLLCRS